MSASTAAGPGRTRALLLVTGTGLAAVVGAQVALPPLRLLLVAGTRAWQRGDAAALSVLPPDEVLAGLCAAALLTALAVWSVGLVGTLVEVFALPARARVTLPRPALVRALTLAALGVGATVAPPALAEPAPEPARPAPAVAPAPERADDVVGLPLPDRVATPRTPTVTGPTGDRAARHVVRRGDTLWSVAARALGPGASAAEVDRAWRRVAAANRDVVADPHLIFPGTELRLPPLADTPGKDPL